MIRGSSPELALSSSYLIALAHPLELYSLSSGRLLARRQLPPGLAATTLLDASGTHVAVSGSNGLWVYDLGRAVWSHVARTPSVTLAAFTGPGLVYVVDTGSGARINVVPNRRLG